MVDDCTPAVVIANPDTHDRAAALGGASLHPLPPQGSAGGTTDKEVQALVQQQVRATRPTTGCLIIYTSGTTGRPKGDTDNVPMFVFDHRSTWVQVCCTRTAA